MRDVVQQLGPVPAHVGVPRVRVDDVAVAGLVGDRQIGRQRAQRGVGAGEHRVVLGVGDRARPRLAHAVHLDVGQLDELANEEVDVHAGTPVHVGRVLAGEDADAHADVHRRTDAAAT